MFVLYKHNRSGKIYQFIAMATHSEDKTPLIIYQDFPKSDLDVVRIWARPLDMFYEIVTMENGEKKPRFEIFDDYSEIFTEEEKKELKEIINGKECHDSVKMRNADLFQKWF